MKNIVVKTKLIAVLLGALSILTFAQAEGITPEAQKVFDSYIEAVGGKEKLESIESIKMEGTMSIPAMGMNASVLMVQKLPNSFYLEQNIPGMGKMRQGYDGKTGWSSDPMQGFRVLQGVELDYLVEENNIRSNLFVADRYSSAKILEGESADGKITIEAVKKSNGSLDTLHFDSETFLLVGMESIEDMGPQGSLPVNITLGTYIDIDGFKSPSKLTITNPSMNIEMTFLNIELNKDIPDDQFTFKQ